MVGGGERESLTLLLDAMLAPEVFRGIESKSERIFLDLTTLPPTGSEAFLRYDCYKAFVKYHARIGTKHFPRMSFDVLRRN